MTKVEEKTKKLKETIAAACDRAQRDPKEVKLVVVTKSAEIEAVKEVACKAGCRRLWLITTNDNLNALRFYQKRGFALVAVHRNALEISRKFKPEIPLIGADGIPLRDEIELEMILSNYQ